MPNRAYALFILILLAFSSSPSLQAQQTQPSENPSHELIYVDPAGVMRWRTTRTEVAMFGANYCLPSASDYRAAGYVHADRKKLIEQDMTHFARMGFDAVRLSFWGDWECCDKQGNLIANDHLDLLDYLIFQAKARDMHMLLSPIVTYDSRWPEQTDNTPVGFSRQFKKDELGANLEAIAAQVNYLQQLLNHVNPYTKLALKDEPYICYIELINEPAHHAGDFDGSVKYINALVDAMRSTGCRKITFYNVSQDFAIGKAIAASRADGSSFAWYPSGLVAGHQLRGNFLRTVDQYPPMLAPELAGKPKIVYEFDMPDVMSGYHYPAMTRTFRSVGAQFAAMFSYDMLATAPFNLGWQTHCLNMVYTPQKAVSAIIASQVMRRIPRGQPALDYPDNTRFGDFRVSYAENLSELVSADSFLYSNDTQSNPPAPRSLRRVIGFGSSPVVQYEGAGIYFLDKIDTGVWRLEVYPDALQIDDPFAAVSADRRVFRLIWRSWPMNIALPDLGDSFKVEPLNSGNDYSTSAANGKFTISPGVFLLTSSARTTPVNLPDRLPRVPYYLGMREFVCPPADDAPMSVVVHSQEEYPIDRPISITATVVDAKAPREVLLRIRSGDTETFKTFSMEHLNRYDYRAILPAGSFPEGGIQFQIGVKTGDKTLLFLDHSQPHETTLSARVVSSAAALVILDPATDVENLAMTRSGERRNRAEGLIDGRAPGAKALRFAFPASPMPDDMSASLYIGDRISDRGGQIAMAKTIHIKLRALAGASMIHLTLIEQDGAGWSAEVNASPQWREMVIPITDLHPAKAAMLPQAFPGTWSYWMNPPAGKGAINLRQIERLQISLRKQDLGDINLTDATVAIENISLNF